jgi:hypothetical protein
MFGAKTQEAYDAALEVFSQRAGDFSSLITVMLNE